jgi:hypothetical protein
MMMPLEEYFSTKDETSATTQPPTLRGLRIHIELELSPSLLTFQMYPCPSDYKRRRQGFI